MRHFVLMLALIVGWLNAVRGDGPKDNLPDSVRSVPPKGIEVPAADRAELDAGVAELGKAIEGLRNSLADKPAQLALLPDVQIFHNAVRYALAGNEIHNAREIPVAKILLSDGMARVKALQAGQAPWDTATGLVVRGYVSKIDGSVQPYGLVVPALYRPGSGQRHRLDFWCHGRGETLSELNFIAGRKSSPGEFTPEGAIVCHLYGRYCNANKFAGEIDLLEVLDDIRKHYPIDENRIVVRGFSMGGAACWQFAVHYASLFAAAAPGAGFSETADFLKVFQKENVQPTWYEKKLWHWYDCTDYAINLYNCPTVAYSGAIDSQKQAADMMAKALADEGMTLAHIIGPDTGHKYHPDAKVEINRRIDAIVARGRNPVPSRVRFTTYTLRYNNMFWVTIDGLGQHWERARVDAEIVDPSTIKLASTNVTELTLSMPAGLCPLDDSQEVKVVVDGQSLTAPTPASDRSWFARFRKSGSEWICSTIPPLVKGRGLKKVHGQQGPIDDAFLDSFLMVRPTGSPRHAKVGEWVEREMQHAIEHWRRQFRGEARVKDDVEVTDDDIASHNLILWGDPASNKLLARIAADLPIKWNDRAIEVVAKLFSVDHHVPALIYPSPLSSQRYVVLNSGFTFREYDYLNNARQVPKLPDYAIIDIRSPVTSRLPGAIAEAGFFGENWELKTGNE